MEINGAWMIMALALGMVLTVTKAADPDILTDFVTGSGSVIVDENFFTFRGFREIGNNNLTGQATAKVTKAAMAEFPGVTGLGVSMAVLQFPAGGVNPPHTHPRGSELLLVLYGTLEVGFVDTTGKLFTQTLEGGDVFIFPKGLLHFQLNKFDNDEAIAISGFGSANAGTVSVPTTLFASGISDDVLVKSFKTDYKTVDALKQALKPSSFMEINREVDGDMK
ncbi:hypothetical protein KI387_016056, partial [Taxus chinensis]